MIPTKRTALHNQCSTVCFEPHTTQRPSNSIHHRRNKEIFHHTSQWTNNNNSSVALSPRKNYTDWAIATCRRNLVPTFVDRGVSRGQRGGSPTVVNLSFLYRSCYFSHSRLIRHENNQVTELSNPLHVKRRLRRQWPSDFIAEREEDE
jgi:hypothetical protein